MTCFVSSLDGANALAARFPSAPVDIVQTQRTPARSDTRCEAVARGGARESASLSHLPALRLHSGADEKAAALAFQRLIRNSTAAGVQPADILETHVYALSERLGELARKVHNNAGHFDRDSV